jgi:hypothetical protein
MSELIALEDTFKYGKPEDEPCKGLIFRCRVNIYQNSQGAYVETKRMIPLIRQSCKGCEKCGWLTDMMDEEIDLCVNWHNGSLFTDDPEDGGTYEYKVTSTSTDWETGIVDDYTTGFVKVKGPVAQTGLSAASS